MVKINGEEKEIAGKNLLEYLKEAGFEPEQCGCRTKSGHYSKRSAWQCDHSG